MMKPIGSGVYSYGSRGDAFEELEAARRIVVPKRGARAAMVRSQQIRRRRFLLGGSFSLLLVVGAAVCTFGEWDDAQFGALSGYLSGTDAAATAMTTSTGAANSLRDDSSSDPSLQSPLSSLVTELLARSALSSCSLADLEGFDRDGDGGLSWHEIASGISNKREEIVTEIHAANLSEPVKVFVETAVTENLSNETTCVQSELGKNETGLKHSFGAVYHTFVNLCDSQPLLTDVINQQVVVGSSESTVDASGSDDLAAGSSSQEQHIVDSTPSRTDSFDHSFGFDREAVSAVGGHLDAPTNVDPASERYAAIETDITAPKEFPVAGSHPTGE